MTTVPPLSVASPWGQPIQVELAQTHNLKGVSCQFPRGQLTVVSGVSGSGKSSLAFDTLYAEGQRRYVETLSTYARQFLAQMRKPPVRDVRNLPPSLALRQGNHVSNARSTVGSVTELADHFQLLFRGAGTMVCKSCGQPVRPHTAGSVVEWLQQNASGERVILLGAAVPAAEESTAVLLRALAAEGHRRVWHKGGIIDIDGPEAAALVDATRLQVVMDRLRIGDDGSRLREAVEAALAFGEGSVEVAFVDRPADGGVVQRIFHTTWRCSNCQTVHHPPVPALFNPQSSVGQCGVCTGFGRVVGVDMARVVPDPRKSIQAGAIVPFETRVHAGERQQLLLACQRRNIPTNVPWRELTPPHRNYVIAGGPGWYGITGFFAELEKERRIPWVRIMVAQYRGYTDCIACGGSGLSDDARAVRVDGLHLGEMMDMRVAELHERMLAMRLSPELEEALATLLAEIRDRLRFLNEAGVGYLTLARQARTLSGGEMHRILLATSVGRMLTDTCYVLDEPTAGLHPSDTERLFKVIQRLRDVGNTVVVVEHDPDVIRQADWIVEMGPRAGEQGGTLMYEGLVDGLRGSNTATGLALAGRTPPTLVSAVNPPEWLRVEEAALNNLQGVSASFPHGCFSVVTGVSGSGKSTLVHDVLYARLLETRGTAPSTPLGPARVTGDTFQEVVLVNQGSISTSSRSCPLTYCGAYNAIRDLFADLPEARAEKLAAGAFSFNTPGGRCEKCEGTGVQTIEMHFMADIELECEDCHGLRFRDRVLAVRFQGASIADVLNMTVSEALTFFAGRGAIVRRLEPMARVGLGYLRLGQATSRLSGGELQRLKLSSYLGSSDSAAPPGTRLFLFDEPTVGLHMQDVDVLVAAMRDLTRMGDTVIVVEHNLDLIAQADWVVDLGPGGGPDGGDIVYQGPLAGLPLAAHSVTGRFLRQSFDSSFAEP